MKTHVLAALLLCACHSHAAPTTTVEAAEPPPVVAHEPEVVAANEPAYLAGIFRHAPLTELVVQQQTVEETHAKVKLELNFFTVSGLAPALAEQLNAAVRKAGRIDEWKDLAKDHGGTVSVVCSVGLAYVELVSFGCDLMDNTLTLEDIANATGGGRGAPAGVAHTFAMADGKLTPVTLADLLLPSADLPALAKRAATEGEYPIANWSEDRCELDGEPTWQLETDGLRIWDSYEGCLSLVIPYEILAPALEPNGVIARYVAITSAAQ